MFKIIIVLIFFSFYVPANSSPKDKVISQLKLTNNLSFNFIQTIDDKNEDGKCIIEYPKKIFCEYAGSNKKIIVSNGKSLVIKIKNSGNYYIYPLKKTPLEFLLDKEYLFYQHDWPYSQLHQLPSYQQFLLLYYILFVIFFEETR